MNGHDVAAGAISHGLSAQKYRKGKTTEHSKPDSRPLYVESNLRTPDWKW
jgi:hypothetical protein